MNTEFISRDNQRIPLESKQLVLGDYTCTEMTLLSTSGASGLVYEGKSYDYYGRPEVVPAKLIIKECYPISAARGIVRNGDTLEMLPYATEDEKTTFEGYLQRYTRAFDSNIALYQSSAKEQISVPSRAIQANGTVYIVNDASNGDTMDIAFSRMSFYRQIKTLIRLCEALAAIHDEGYVHLDLKPENILCIRNSDAASEDEYYSDIRLFDFDSVMPIEGLADARIMIPSSGDWSSFEQTHSGHEADLGKQSDIYTIGALLFWAVIGRPPTSNEVIHAHGNWSLSADDFVSEIKVLASDDTVDTIKRVFNRTLVVGPGERYRTSSDVASDLKQLGELVMPVGTTMASRFDNLTAGQNRLEKQMSELMQLLQGGALPSPDQAINEIEDNVKPTTKSQDGIVVEHIEPSDDDIFEIATETILVASRLSNLKLSGIPDSLQERIANVSIAAKKALDEREKDVVMSLAEETGILSSAAVVLAEIGIASDLDGCPPVLIEAVRATVNSLEHALCTDNLPGISEISERLEASMPLLLKGVGLSMVRKTLEGNLSTSMLGQIDESINVAADAISGEDAALISKVASDLEALESAAMEDAYMGMISTLL